MESGIQDSGFVDGSRQLNPDSRTVQLIVAYDGTAFHGFQRLKHGRTVQGVLEAAWLSVTGETARLTGAGRTDAGVHALGQSISLRTEARIPIERIPRAMNGRLPADIMVRRAHERRDGFHARFSATQRTYRYFVRRCGRPSLFWDRYSLRETGALDVPAMRETAAGLLGTHDFRSFGLPQPDRSSLRDLRSVRFREWRGWLIISLTANAFLKGMARSLAAQFLEVGRGEASPLEIWTRLHACDRGVAGKAAPPNGLFLARVEYGSIEFRVPGSE
ncbi:MAG TPA: tRNA pseudouridine(38-40) synthase TruA [Armatimonadota bacterium]